MQGVESVIVLLISPTEFLSAALLVSATVTTSAATIVAEAEKFSVFLAKGVECGCPSSERGERRVL